MDDKNDSKITDFFPISPKQSSQETQEGGKKQVCSPETYSSAGDSTSKKEDYKASDGSSKSSSEVPKPESKQTKAPVIDLTPESPASTMKNERPLNIADGTKVKKRRGRKPKGKAPQVKEDPKTEGETKAGTKSKGRPKKKEETPSHQLTEYYQVRRSDRRLKTDFEKQKKQMLEEAILSGCEDGLKVVDFEGKGRGVVSTKLFKRGDFVVEYAGNLIDLSKAKKKEEEYSQDPDIGCYMYYFNYDNRRYCVDATAESGLLGRLLNHSKSGNCKTKVVGIGDRPYLILVAARDISIGDELLYDYGDRSKASLEAHPWLAK